MKNQMYKWAVMLLACCWIGGSEVYAQDKQNKQDNQIKLDSLLSDNFLGGLLETLIPFTDEVVKDLPWKDLTGESFNLSEGLLSSIQNVFLNTQDDSKADFQKTLESLLGFVGQQANDDKKGGVDGTKIQKELEQAIQKAKQEWDKSSGERQQVFAKLKNDLNGIRGNIIEALGGQLSGVSFQESIKSELMGDGIVNSENDALKLKWNESKIKINGKKVPAASYNKYREMISKNFGNSRKGNISL